MHSWLVAHYGVLKDFSTPLVALVGLLITLGLGVAGFRTFGKWRRETIEERRIDVAIDALTIAYESKFVFHEIRTRRIRGEELEAVHEEGADSFRVTLREGQKGAYAVLKRIAAYEEFFDRVTKVEPKFMAVFGSETEEIFASLYMARNELESAAETLFEEERIERDAEDTGARDRKRQLREKIFRNYNEVKEKDKVGELADSFRTRIEKICRPIVDQRYGKRESPV